MRECEPERRAKKFQTPMFKCQKKSNAQISTATCAILSVLVVWDFFGIWRLEFEIFYGASPENMAC
jgi:hypothetical protein